MPDLTVFNGSEAKREIFIAGVERELGNQSQTGILQLCVPKYDTTGAGKVFIRIMGASKAVRRTEKFAQVAKSKGGKFRTIELTLNEIIANDAYLDKEAKQTDISLDTELMKNQADSITVDKQFRVIDVIEEGVTAGTIQVVNMTTEPSIYKAIVNAMTGLVGYTQTVGIVVDRYGYGAMLQDDKLINRDFHDAYLAKNGNIDGLPVAGGRVVFMMNLEKDVYGVDSYLEKGVAYLIGYGAIGTGEATGIVNKTGWNDDAMHYYIQSIAYFNAVVKHPKMIIKLLYQVPAGVAKALTASAAGLLQPVGLAIPRTTEPNEDLVGSRMEQLEKMTKEELQSLLTVNKLVFKSSDSKADLIDAILTHEFGEGYDDADGVGDKL